MKFRPNDKLWAISPQGKVYDVRITHVNARIFDDEKGLVCYLVDYEGNTFNHSCEGVSFSFKQHELYRNKGVATRNAKFTPIIFTDDEWYTAIGLKKGVKRIYYNEDCDLGPCCGQISDIRDALDVVRKNGGVTARGRRELQSLLNGHEPVTSAIKLFDILKTIGVVWEDI